MTLNRRKLLEAVVAAGVASCLPVSAVGQARAYTVTDLGPGRGDWSIARQINNRGEILGTWGTAIDASRDLVREAHSVVWRGDGELDLTALGFGSGIAINNTGLVLGSYRDRGLLYDPALGTVLPIPGFSQNAFPAAINDAGVVVGQADSQGAMSADGIVTALSAPAGYGIFRPSAINGTGEVIGEVRLELTQDASQRAAIYMGGITTVLPPAPRGNASTATDINDLGMVVGHGGNFGMHGFIGAGHAFLYDPANQVMTDLGTLPGFSQSAALSMNNAGQVVGYALGAESGTAPFTAPFLYDPVVGTMIDLNDLIPASSGWHLLKATGINDLGEIVGRGMIGGQVHGFVLQVR